MGKDKHERSVDNTNGRDGLTFLLLPDAVLRSPGYRQAGHVARSLLIDIAMQYTKNKVTREHNNGKLVACDKYLKPLGWKSHDVVTRAIRELLNCGLLIETRKGARPNRTAWYALPWYSLNVRQGLDINPKYYDKGAYNRPEPIASKGNRFIPSRGEGDTTIAPSRGGLDEVPSPSHGAMHAVSGHAPAPRHGGCLEKPSAGLNCRAATTGTASASPIP